MERGQTENYKDVFAATIDNKAAKITAKDVSTLEKYEKLLYA